MLTVADIMTTDLFTIRSSAKVTQAIALMQEKTKARARKECLKNYALICKDGAK